MTTRLRSRVSDVRAVSCPPSNDNDSQERKPGKTRVRIPLEDRFWAKVDKSGDCWIWLGDRDHHHGYGHFMAGSRVDHSRKLWQAHRLAWFLTYGTLPALLRHFVCGNTSCVNPAHLKPGTQAENMADMVRMGRSTVGERNPSSKLTADRVRSIFARIQAGNSSTVIGRDEGVSASTVWQVANGVMWAHVTGLPRRIPKRDRRSKRNRHLLPSHSPASGGTP